MRRLFIALAIVTTLVATAGAGTVAAQSSSPAPTTTATDGGEDTGPIQTVIQVGPNVDVVSYSYSDGTFEVVLHADHPTRIEIADVLGAVEEKGARRVPSKSVWVDGETTVTMEVGTYRGAAAVSVGSSSGSVYLSTGIQPINPLAGGSATVGWVGGSALAILMFVAAALWVMRQEGGAPEVATDA